MKMKWISVEERLPEPDNKMKYTYYITIHATWDNFCRILMFDNDEHTWTRDGDDTQKVTHWMPLPEPPTNKI